MRRAKFNFPPNSSPLAGDLLHIAAGDVARFPQLLANPAN
jgi:hypothetical protein